MQYIWSEQGQLPVQAQRIRRDVFMQEQGFCDEFDAVDKKAGMFCCKRMARPLAQRGCSGSRIM